MRPKILNTRPCIIYNEVLVIIAIVNPSKNRRHINAEWDESL